MRRPREQWQNCLSVLPDGMCMLPRCVQGALSDMLGCSYRHFDQTSIFWQKHHTRWLITSAVRQLVWTSKLTRMSHFISQSVTSRYSIATSHVGSALCLKQCTAFTQQWLFPRAILHSKSYSSQFLMLSCVPSESVVACTSQWKTTHCWGLMCKMLQTTKFVSTLL